MSAVRVVRATAEDLRALRARVLGDGRPGRRAAIRGDHAATTRHWAARVGDEVVGCATVMRLRGWALRAMAVDPAWQGRGVGAALLARVQAEVAAPMWCNAREGAVGFYAARGWSPEGPRFVIEGEGTHQRMTWTPPSPDA